jgi:hypothetical protein
MPVMVAVEVDPARAVPVAAGKGARAKSTFAQRLEALGALLASEGGASAPATKALTYVSLRAALASEFVSRFGMARDGALKVAGDALGSSAHGLGLRRSVDGKEVVLVSEAASRVELALSALRSLPAGAKAALPAVRLALGLPVAGKAVAASTVQAQPTTAEADEETEPDAASEVPDADGNVHKPAPGADDDAPVEIIEA